jgi:sugar lactone lactonase YvrE
MKTITKFIYLAFAVVSLAIGAATANGAPNDLFASINGTGDNGGGFIYEYTPTGVQSIFASGLSRPRGIAFDQFGNLFVTTTTFDGVSQTFQGAIVKITPQGVPSVFAPVPGDNVFLEGLAFDGAGNLFVMAIGVNDPNSASTIFKFTPNGVQSTFGSIPGQGFGLAFDSAGNLFAADAGLADNINSTIWKFAPDGTRSIFADQTAFLPCQGVQDLAFDRFGNLFVSESAEIGCPLGARIDKFTPDGVESAFATGLNSLRGLAFDRGGNLFGADAILVAGEILKFTLNGVGSVFASEIDGPEFLTIQLRPAVPPHPTPPPHP